MKWNEYRRISRRVRLSTSSGALRSNFWLGVVSGSVAAAFNIALLITLDHGVWLALVVTLVIVSGWGMAAGSRGRLLERQAAEVRIRDLQAALAGREMPNADRGRLG